MNWYYKLLVHRPYLVLLSVSVFSVACIVTSYVSNKLPDFTDPTIGFEARGTFIGQKLTAWRNLLDESGNNKLLVANPKDLLTPVAIEEQPNLNRKSGRRKNATSRSGKKKNSRIKVEEKLRNMKVNQIHFDEEVEKVQMFENETDYFMGLNRSIDWEYGRNLSFVTDEKDQKLVHNKAKWADLRRPKPPSSKMHIHDGFFCDSPRNEYAHFVLKAVDNTNNSSLFNLNNLLAVCDLEMMLTSINDYKDICQTQLSSPVCCRPWSITNYVALLANKDSCFEITEEDIQMVRSLLLECFPYFDNLKLSNDCTQSICRVPKQCAEHNAVYNILHFLADIDFINLNESTATLKTTMIFLPIARSSNALRYYHNLEKSKLYNFGVQVVAMDMGLKNALFDECLLTDGWLVALGGVFVLFCMWIYTSSLFVTLMTIVAIIFSLGIAYFIYTLVFDLTFFPFMNLLAVIVVVGIGADDAFIFMKIWKCVLNEKVKSSGMPLAHASATCLSEIAAQTHQTDALVVAIKNTLKHASISMLVTSLTTAAAFYASFCSSITAVRCFGIFAGTAVLTNYLLMVTWLPATVTTMERVKLKFKLFKLKRLHSPIKTISQLGKQLQDIIVKLVIKLPLLWVIILGGVGIFCGIIVLYWPKLKLPDSPDFKLFISRHPFELYDSLFKEHFWFEKTYASTDSFKLPLRFVWGIQPIDTGNYLDPLSRGKLHFDNTFNVSSPDSQVWLLNFCKELKEQAFTSMSLGLLLPNCFIENFITWMSRRCLDEMSGINRYPCCEESTFPFSTEVFDTCLPESISSLYETPREFFMPGVAGPKFSRKMISVTNDTIYSPVLAVVIEYDSTQLFTMSYTDMALFVHEVEAWLKDMLTTAPIGLRNGWFVSDLEFYDLQDTLSNGTIVAIGVAMSVALFVLLLVTLNVLISLYAILTVTFTIFTTIATLIGLGWKLNVLESVAVSTAIGLAVDFSLHYGVHYRLSGDPDRRSSVKFSLSRMFEPTLMNALTTIMAGALMLPSNVLAYIQIGIFLVVVMTISWIYATFFLMGLLRLIGPEYGFGQFSFPKFGKNSSNRSNTLNHVDTNARIVHHQSIGSEQLISVSELVTSESHELDSLTSNSIVRPLEYSRPSNLPGFKKKYSLPRENSPSIGSIVTVLPEDELSFVTQAK